MNKKCKQHYLYIDGKAVPVTEKVYRAFWHYEDKEDYFMRLLKTPRNIRNKENGDVVAVPPREVPLDQIPVWRRGSTATLYDVEDLVLSGIWLEQVLDTLTEEERRIVQEFYINGKNEREACAALGLPKTTFRRREQRLREKLGILLKNFL